MAGTPIQLQQAEGWPSIRIFAEPRVGAQLRGEVASGTWVQWLGATSGDFVQVSHGDVEGWVGRKNAFLENHVVLRQAEGHPSVRVFSEPRSGADVVGEVPSGQPVRRIGEEDDFIRVLYEDGPIDGWVGIKNIAEIAEAGDVVKALIVSVAASMMSGSKVFGPQDLPGSSTVRALKEQVSEAVGAAPAAIQLTLGERVLRETETLDSLSSSTLNLGVAVLDKSAQAAAKWMEWWQQDCHHTGRTDMPGLRLEKGQVSVFEGGSWEFVLLSVKFQEPVAGEATPGPTPPDAGAWEEVMNLAVHPIFSHISERLREVHTLIQECDLSVAISTTRKGEWSVSDTKTKITLSTSSLSMTMFVHKLTKETF